MKMIKPDNLKSLIDIEKQTGIHINDLISTYTRKEIQYSFRDNKDYNMGLITPEHGDRALGVMKEYAVRKLGYKRPLSDYDYSDFHAWWFIMDVEYEMGKLWEGLRGLTLENTKNLDRIQELEKKVARLESLGPIKED